MARADVENVLAQVWGAELGDPAQVVGSGLAGDVEREVMLGVVAYVPARLGVDVAGGRGVVEEAGGHRGRWVVVSQMIAGRQGGA